MLQKLKVIFCSHPTSCSDTDVSTNRIFVSLFNAVIISIPISVGQKPCILWRFSWKIFPSNSFNCKVSYFWGEPILLWKYLKLLNHIKKMFYYCMDYNLIWISFILSFLIIYILCLKSFFLWCYYCLKNATFWKKEYSHFQNWIVY
jgi:hypothetical protein